MTVIVSESEPITIVLATFAVIGTLVLAWRGYRHAAREDYERELAMKRRRDR